MAQACCASAGAVQPTRLLLTEDLLVAVQLRVQGVIGQATASGRYILSPAGTHEVDGEEMITIAGRVFQHLQLTAALPIEEASRTTPTLSETSIGVGDALLGARYAFIEPGGSERWPGIALTATLTFPTGRAPEAADLPLATDATGRGEWRGALGVEVEKLFDPILLYAAVSGAWAAPRAVAGAQAQSGPELSVVLAAGYAWTRATAALTASYLLAGDSRLAGTTEANSGRQGLRFAAAFGTTLSEDFRMQAQVYADTFIRNDLIAIGATVVLIRRWP
jgi:hypothetical protein